MCASPLQYEPTAKHAGLRRAASAASAGWQAEAGSRGSGNCLAAGQGEHRTIPAQYCMDIAGGPGLPSGLGAQLIAAMAKASEAQGKSPGGVPRRGIAQDAQSREAQPSKACTRWTDRAPHPETRAADHIGQNEMGLQKNRNSGAGRSRALAQHAHRGVPARCASSVTSPGAAQRWPPHLPVRIRRPGGAAAAGAAPRAPPLRAA